MLGPFELGEPIGRGGMGVVWSGRHVEQDVPVAIKVMTAKTGRKAEHVAAFRREVRAVAGLHHPGIIMVFDFGLVPGSTERATGGQIKAGWPYLVMELSSRGSLDRIDAPLSWDQIRSILGSVLDGLAHAHARGVIHRDIKPANVLLGSDAQARPGLKLTDFGIAHAMRGPVRSGTTEQTMGTPHFMAPEQFEGRWRDHGPWTDLYALGCMAWEMVCGAPLFDGGTFWEIAFKHMREPPPRIKAQVPVPDGFEDWLGRLLAKAPEDRFQHASDAASALGQLSGVPGVEIDLEAGQTPSGRWVLDLGQATELGGDTLEDRPAQGPGSTLVDGATLDATAGALPALPAPLPNRAPSRWSLPSLPETWRRDETPGPSMQLVGAGLGLYGLRVIPLVDRESERDRVWAALRGVGSTGRARMILLRGASGHGTTRLVEWLCARALELGGAEIFEAACGEGLGAEEVLATMVGDRLRCMGLAPAELAERLQRIMARRGIDDDYEWRALTALIAPGSDVEETRAVRFASPRARYVLIARLLERAARVRPVIVAVDDVHWGADALAFAEFLLDRQSKVARPILLLMTAQEEGLAQRPEESAQIDTLASRGDVEVISVGPLMVRDRAALVEELLGLGGDLAQRVEARSGGNPAFAVQLVGDWVQRGVLDVGPTGFVLRDGERAELPDSLHQMWAARLSRLGGGVSEALEVAAALGQSVRTREWAAICARLGIALPDIGPGLLRHRLVETFEGGWSFTQNAIRESLERSAREGGRWARHHAACAKILGHLDPPPEARLGRHLLEAGAPDEAFDRLSEAITGRLDVSNYRGAADLLRLQERALSDARADAHDPRWTWLWTQRARVHVLRGQPAEATRWATRASTHARHNHHTEALGDAQLSLAHATRGQGQTTEALDLYRQTLEIYHRQGQQRGVSDCLRAMGQLRGSPEPRETRIGHFERALSICRHLRDDLSAADCLRGLSQLVHATGDLDRAASLGEMALEMFEAVGNPLGVAHCLNAGAEIARYRGDLDSAEGGYRRALALYEAVGSGSTTLPKLNLGLVLLARAQYGEARRLFETVRAVLEKAGRKVFLGAVHANLLPTAAAAHDWIAWDHHHTTATALLASTNLCDDDIAWPAQIAGDLARDAGQPERARQAYTLALEQWTALEQGDKAEDVRAAIAGLGA